MGPIEEEGRTGSRGEQEMLKQGAVGQMSTEKDGLYRGDRHPRGKV